MASFSIRVEELHVEPVVPAVDTLTLPPVELANATGALVAPVTVHRTLWVRRALPSVFLGMIDFWKSVWSPGLKDMPRISTIDIRNGGQHRF